MQYYAIIVASGSGNRMGQSLPKQFSLLDKLPMLYYSLKAFHKSKFKPQIILVLNPGHVQLWEELLEKYKIKIPHQIVSGGKERFHSVKNGLNCISSTDALVAIHDGARPLIKPETIDKIYEDAANLTNAIPVIPAAESVRYDQKIIDRSLLTIVQTPQIFSAEILKVAYRQEYDPMFTDDASVIESAGFKIYFTEGQRSNIKITFKEDLVIAENLLKI